MKKYKLYDKALFTVDSSLGRITLFSLWIPILFETVMNQLQGTVNTAVLSGYSETSVSAVGSVNTVFSVLLLLGTVLATGATVVVGNLIGGEKIREAGEASVSALFFGVAISLIVTPLLFLASPAVMRFLQLEGMLYSEGLLYFRVRVLFYPFSVLTSTVLALLKCYGYPRYTFFVSFVINLLNLLLNLFVIYCPKISPVTGVLGVALGAGLSTAIGLALAVFLLFRLGIRLRIPSAPSRFWEHLSRVLRIGIPGGVSGMTFAVVTMLTTAFVPAIGSEAIAAKVYYQNILCYAYLFSVSIGNANALLVSRRFGRQEYDLIEKMNRMLVRITRVINLSVSLLLLLLSRFFVGIFTESPAIISGAFLVFAVDLIVEQARAESQVYEYALRATGDVMFTTIFVVISCFLFGFALAYFLAIPCGFGLVGLWLGLAADELTRAVVSRIRFHGGKWRRAL